jgi:uncharacterized membrane protein
MKKLMWLIILILLAIMLYFSMDDGKNNKEIEIEKPAVEIENQ